MALNYQDSPESGMLHGIQPLQGGVVYNQNPGWLATLLSVIKNTGSAIGQGTLATPALNNGTNFNNLPTNVVQKSPDNPIDTSATNNAANFKNQNTNPYKSPLQQAYANLQTASSPKPQLAYTILNSPSVQKGLNGLVGAQIPTVGSDPFISQANYWNSKHKPELIAQVPPVPGPGVVQKWSDAQVNPNIQAHTLIAAASSQRPT